MCVFRSFSRGLICPSKLQQEWRPGGGRHGREMGCQLLVISLLGEQNKSRGQTGAPASRLDCAVRHKVPGNRFGAGGEDSQRLSAPGRVTESLRISVSFSTEQEEGHLPWWCMGTTKHRQAGSILRRKISKDRKRDGRSTGFGANFRNHLCSESGEGSVRQTPALSLV